MHNGSSKKEIHGSRFGVRTFSVRFGERKFSNTDRGFSEKSVKAAKGKLNVLETEESAERGNE